nr:aminoglycoside phosphotransferase family protein [Streptomyces sp. 135]
MDEVEVVVAHSERATLHVGDVFLKVDADQARIDAEAMTLAPVPTPEVLWRKPSVLAIAAVPGTALGSLGKPSTASPAAWVAAGAAIRKLHDAPLPPWPGRARRGPDELAADLDGECEVREGGSDGQAPYVKEPAYVLDAANDSFTVLFEDGDGWSVREGGPMSLWGEAEQSLALWHAAGSPAVTEFGVSVEPDRQRIWLENAADGPSWCLPVAPGS